LDAVLGGFLRQHVKVAEVILCALNRLYTLPGEVYTDPLDAIGRHLLQIFRIKFITRQGDMISRQTPHEVWLRFQRGRVWTGVS
jgi:hypothetical protein